VIIVLRQPGEYIYRWKVEMICVVLGWLYMPETGLRLIVVREGILLLAVRNVSFG